MKYIIKKSAMQTLLCLETVVLTVIPISTDTMVVRQDSSASCSILMSCQLMSRSAVGVTPVSLVSTSTSMTLPTR